MKNLKNIGLSLMLTGVLATAVFAGETPTPPCVPGETQSPPCPTQSVSDDPVVPGETSTTSDEPVVYVTDIAETLIWSLLLF